jgi:hypothetical protein
LHRRTLDRAIGTKHAAIAGLRLKTFITSLANIKELASIRGHALDRAMAATGTCDDRIQLHDYRTVSGSAGLSTKASGKVIRQLPATVMTANGTLTASPTRP